jgi:hypothetical protein
LEDLRIESAKSNILIGKWIKITKSKCSKIYPDKLEFRKNGIYLGKRKKSSPSWWDLGDYRILNENKLKISTADDSIQKINFKIQDNKLEFIDDTLCKFSYIRTK